MRALTDGQNINPIDSDFVKGSTRNKVSGGDPGTIWSEEVMGDLVQTFQKLIALNGLTENGLKDNETNKHQLLAALFQEGLPEWKPTTSNVDFDNIKFVRYEDGIYFHKTTTNTDTNPSSDATNWTELITYNTAFDNFNVNADKLKTFIEWNAYVGINGDILLENGPGNVIGDFVVTNPSTGIYKIVSDNVNIEEAFIQVSARVGAPTATPSRREIVYGTDGQSDVYVYTRDPNTGSLVNSSFHITIFT